MEDFEELWNPLMENSQHFTGIHIAKSRLKKIKRTNQNLPKSMPAPTQSRQ